jgi:hypothetical protein
MSGTVSVRFRIDCLLRVGKMIPPAVREWLPAISATVTRALEGKLLGSGCSGSFSNGVLVAITNLGLTIGKIPVAGLELGLTMRFLIGLICADDQPRFSKCRLGQSVYLTTKLFAFGMAKQYVIPLEPLMSPACGNRQWSFQTIRMGSVGTGWDASDGFSYNMYEIGLCGCI